MPTHSPCLLYLISPPAINLVDFKEQLREALDAGGVGAFQLRLKEASDAEILRAAEALLPVCREYNTPFILNDRTGLAAKCGADGVHLGQEDIEQGAGCGVQGAEVIPHVSRMLGEDAIIGVSAHASRHLAMEAGEAGADYVAFGAFYPTRSKPREKIEKWGTPTPEILEWWSANTVVPCVAIGGMTPQTCGPCVAAGADFIAAITAVWNDPQGPGNAVEKFNKTIKIHSRETTV